MRAVDKLAWIVKNYRIATYSLSKRDDQDMGSRREAALAPYH